MENLPARLEHAIEPLQRYWFLALEARRIKLLNGVCQLAVGDVCPGADDLRGVACFITEDLESILEPAIVALPVAEAVFQVTSALRY
jgi:hypothetical protein